MNREDVAMDVTVQNVEILRGRLEQAEALLREMRTIFSIPPYWHERIDALLALRQGERNQCDGCQAGIPLVDGAHRIGRPGGYPDLMRCQKERYEHPEQAEDDIKKLIVLLRHGDAMPGEQDLAADHLERLLKAEQAEGAQGERNGWGTLPIVRVPWNVFDRAVMWVEDRRRYGDDGTIVDDWKALKAIQRAALAQPSPAPELERPEVVAWMWRDLNGDMQFNYMHPEGEPLMTVAQHAGIVAKWASLFNRVQDRAYAAQARVAELEKQEPVALANRGLHAFWVRWTEAAAGLYGPGIKLYAHPVAQAGQVPDALREAVEYLDSNPFNEIGSGSILHRQMRDALAAAPAQGMPSEAELEAAGLGYPLSKEEAVARWNDRNVAQPAQGGRNE